MAPVRWGEPGDRSVLWLNSHPRKYSPGQQKLHRTTDASGTASAVDRQRCLEQMPWSCSLTVQLNGEPVLQVDIPRLDCSPHS